MLVRILLVGLLAFFLVTYLKVASKLDVSALVIFAVSEGCTLLALTLSGSSAEFVGQNGASQQQAGESVTRGDRRRRELWLKSSSPPLARLLLGCLTAFGGFVSSR